MRRLAKYSDVSASLTNRFTGGPFIGSAFARQVKGEMAGYLLSSAGK